MNRNIENNLERIKPYESLEENLFNNKKFKEADLIDNLIKSLSERFFSSTCVIPNFYFACTLLVLIELCQVELESNQISLFAA
jgi:hypothetical protein